MYCTEKRPLSIAAASESKSSEYLQKETAECNVYDAVQASESKSGEYLNIFLSQTRSGFYRSREADSDTA